MLPAMCRIDPCMNIEVNTVSQVGIVLTTPAWRVHPSSSPANVLTTPQCSPEWVSAYGIAPYFAVSCTSGPEISEPPWRTLSR